MLTRKDYIDAWIDSMFSDLGVRKPTKSIIEESNQPAINPFEIQSILSNKKKNAFTVVWSDGTHTTVHCQPGDIWDDEKALAMCFTKKALGNQGNFNDKFNDAFNNKMKVIPAEPTSEKMCECGRDSTCEECKCKKSVTEVAEKSTKNEGSAPYKVYIKINGDSHYDSEHYTVSSLREHIYKVAEKLLGRKPSYYRTWMGKNNRMQVDFGHYTLFIEVERITPDEYAKN